MLRFTIVLVGTAFVAQSFASFEMILIPDYQNHVVHRVDPINRVYLGSFGQNQLFNPISVVYLPSLQKSFVYDFAYDSVSAFNPFTGESLGTTFLSGSSVFSAMTVNGTNLFVANGLQGASGAYRILDSNLNTLSTISVSGLGANEYVASVQRVGTTDYIATLNVGGNSRLLSRASNGTITQLFQTTSTLNTITTSGNYLFVSSAQNAGTADMIAYNLTNGAITSSFGSTSYARATLQGHGASMYTVGENSTLNGCQVEGGLLTPNGTIINVSTWTVPNASSAIGASCILVAPEPASMGILAFGLTALLRRRRS